MHQPHLSLAFLHSHDFDELVPTLKLLLALLPALVALAYGIVRPKPQTPPRKAGALDKWRSALASLAVVLLVARSVVGKGQVAALTAAYEQDRKRSRTRLLVHLRSRPRM